METFTARSPAKLNLFLHITGRRADGYHELQTLFQLLDFSDTLHFSPNESGNITLEMPDLGIPFEENLIVRAARRLQSGASGVHIAVDKQIPAGGGLGGGSSNAATALLVLNRLWSCHRSPAELALIGAELGADVPIFLGGRTAWAEGIGEVLAPVELPQKWYFVLAPDVSVSTAEIFSHRQLTRDACAIKMAAFFEGDSRNDCQPLVQQLYPEVAKALNWLNNFGEARLTGTGACIFASFASKADAELPLRALPAQWRGFVARGLNYSPKLSDVAGQ